MSAINGDASVFVSIRRVDPRGVECWSSREFAEALGYSDLRNFQVVLDKARLACLNSGQPIEDHFVDITEMILHGYKGLYGGLTAQDIHARKLADCRKHQEAGSASKERTRL